MKKIAIITATRAEYGILKPLIEQLRKEPEFDVRLIVTGTHLLPEYGMTYRNIEADGVKINAMIEIPMDTGSGSDVSKCIAVAIEKFSDYFSKDRPDLLILLGDRYELMGFAIAAFNERIPIAHLCGGESTEGAVDEAYRHALTKMSYLHFTTTEAYRQRVIQLGESPDRVYNSGALVVDGIKQLKVIPKAELEDFLGLKLDGKYALMTFHPVTLEGDSAENQAEELIRAMSERGDITFICTKSNADVGGMIINEALEKAAKQYDNIHLYASLGQTRYLSLVKDAAFLLGNTSSGLGDAPVFRTPTVNVGDRQKGRLRAASIVDCETKAEAIGVAIDKVMSDKFLDSIRDMSNPYGDGNAAVKITNILKDRLNGDINLKKSFYDIDFSAR